MSKCCQCLKDEAQLCNGCAYKMYYADPAALLSVLRQCVAPLAIIDGIGHADNAQLLSEVRAALAAAAPYLESKEGEA